MLHTWAEAHLPDAFLKPALSDWSGWQLALLPVVVLVAYLAARIGAASLRPALVRLTRFTKGTWDDVLIERSRGPIRLALTGVFARLTLAPLELQGQALVHSGEATRIIFLLATFWALLRAVDVSHSALKDSEWLKERPQTRPILALLERVLKIVVVALAVVSSLQQLGYPVAGLIAGLGVGGLAVALSAQKTLEHVLGSVMLSVDQPLQVGNVIRVGDIVGTVESIGLRSTRIRSVTRTMIAIPNGKLADSNIENISWQDRAIFQTQFNLRHGTTLAQVRAIVDDIRKVLASEERFVAAERVAHVKNLSDAGISLEVTGWTRTNVGEDPRDVRQDILFAIMGIIEQHGSALAAPVTR